MRIRVHPYRLIRSTAALALLISLAPALGAARAEEAPAPAPVLIFDPSREVTGSPEVEEAPRTQEEEASTITAVVTAYAPGDNRSGMCADSDPSVTSTGKAPGPAYCAADPARLPYGTRLEIPGYGTVEVQDTGGALRSDKDNIRIDVWMPTYDDAIEWGRQELEVTIL